jgi:DNA-binding response OmpR family regulator
MATAGSKTVLILEDEVFLNQILASRLKEAGLRVVQAYNGEEGLNLMRENQPDLVLVDIILPGKLNGFEVLEKMQTDPLLQSLPVVVISNLGQETDIQRGKQLGVIDYFVKAQTSIDNLVKKIKEILENQPG